MPGLTTSLRWMTPSTGPAPAASLRRDHQRGTARAGDRRRPSRAPSCRPARDPATRPTAEPAPLRTCVPSARSTPLIRVWAVNSTNVAPAGRSSVVGALRRGRGRRSSGPRASRRRGCESRAASRELVLARRPAAARSGWPAGCRGDGAGLVEQQRATSPAASTARPDMASTLRRTSRSMPAMPIAESSAPMVVGIRQTSSATRTTTVLRARRCRSAIGASVATASRKIERQGGEQDRQGDLVGRLPARGALDQRDHPVDEGLARPRGDPHDDPVRQHRVPPVTALRSPPDSRMTGADSPVIADSSTEATPSTTSPSPGITLAGLDDDQVADPQLRWPATCVSAAVGQPSRRAVGLGAARRAGGRLGLAAALGDGLGEVGEEHGQPEPDGDRDGEDVRGRRRRATVVAHRADLARRTSPGCATAAGVELAQAAAGLREQLPAGRRCRCGRGDVHDEGLRDRSEGEGREEGEAGHDQR